MGIRKSDFGWILFIIWFGMNTTFSGFTENAEIYQSPFIMKRGAILVNGGDDNLPAFYILDTFVSIPVLHEPQLTSLNKEEKRNNYTLKNSSLDIPFLPIYQGKVLRADLSGISKKIGVPINGILPIYHPGYEIYLDFGKGKITWQLLSPQRKIKTKDMFCEKIYFNKEKTIPQIPITINNTFTHMANIDLLRSESVIFPMRLTNEQKLVTGDSKFAHFHGRKTIQYFRLNSLKVGSLKMNHLLCVSVPGEKDISLGTSFWRQFVIQISYEKASMCFLKTQITEQQAWIGLGIVLDFLSEEGWVIGVVEDSPAWEHNLRGGEVLVAIDDWQVQSLDAEQITTLLNPSEGTLKRCKFLGMDGQEKIFDLVSRKII